MKLYAYDHVEDTSTFAYEKLRQILKQDYNYEFNKFIYNKFNKPYLPTDNIYFNISHCKDIVVIAINDKEIGVDIEFYDRYNTKYLDQIFSTKEIEQIKKSTNPNKEYSILWCMKESLLKCIGTGIKKDMKHVLENKDLYNFNIEEYKEYCIVICTIKK